MMDLDDHRWGFHNYVKSYRLVRFMKELLFLLPFLFCVTS